MKINRKTQKRIALSALSLIVGISVSEILLGYFRPPQIHVQGTIHLSRNVTIKNSYNFNSSKLQNDIIVRKNSLGFRGPDPPIDFVNHKTIIAIGGSTTECYFITDGNTWTDIVQKNLKKIDSLIWINNAGIDGHSTIGHNKLMKEYIRFIKPTYVLFLIGINDIAVDVARRYDTRPIISFEEDAKIHPLFNVIQKSMLYAYLQYVRAPKGAHMLTSDSNHITSFQQDKNQQHIPLTETDLKQFSERATSYKERLKSLISYTKEQGITPILITQPAVYGFGIDPLTGIDLGNMIVEDFTENNIPRLGSDKWKILQLYNTSTKELASEMNISVIDLAQEMPKNTLFYYDYIHFSEAGAAVVGNILSRHLREILQI